MTKWVFHFQKLIQIPVSWQPVKTEDRDKAEQPEVDQDNAVEEAEKPANPVLDSPERPPQPEIETVKVNRPTRKAALKAKQLFKRVLRIHANKTFKHAWIYDPHSNDDDGPAYLITTILPTHNAPTLQPDLNISPQIDDLDHPEIEDSFTFCSSGKQKLTTGF